MLRKLYYIIISFLVKKNKLQFVLFFLNINPKRKGKYTIIKVLDIDNEIQQSNIYSKESWKKKVDVFSNTGSVVSQHIFSSHVICFKGFKIFSQSSFLFSKDEKVAYINMANPNDPNCIYTTTEIVYLNSNNSLGIFRKITNEKLDFDKAVNFVGKASSNYYHLLTEILTKFYFLNKVDEYFNYPIAIDELVMEIPQFRRLIELLNTRKQNIILIKKDKEYSFQDLIFISDGARMAQEFFNTTNFTSSNCIFQDEAIFYIRDKILASYLKSNNAHNKKIFIGRRTSDNRKTNEEELWQIAKKFGFERIFPEELTIDQQVEIFSNCDFVIGNSGAGLSNIIFMQASSSVFYWISGHNNQFNFFSSLASLVKCNISFISGNATNRFNLQSAFKVDSELFDFELRKVLKL